MRDPDLIGRAQRAAIELERAWDRWRTMHGLGREPMPAVSSYVGYSLEEPWGQPRVVFGIEAREAEQMAALLDRHDCAGPVYAGLSAMPGARTEESADYLGAPTERRRVVVPSQSQGGVAEREAAWREATWREAAVREPAMEQAPPEPHLLAEVPRQQAAGEPVADADETAAAEVAEPYDEDEPGLLEDADPGDDEDEAPLASFRPRAEPGPQASDGEEEREDEDDQVGDEPEKPAEADQGSPPWRRQGRAARGHALSRQKRSGGAAREGNGR